MRLYIDSYEKDAKKIHQDPQVGVKSEAWHRWFAALLKSMDLCLVLLCLEPCAGCFGRKGFDIFNPSVNSF